MRPRHNPKLRPYESGKEDDGKMKKVHGSLQIEAIMQDGELCLRGGRHLLSQTLLGGTHHVPLFTNVEDYALPCTIPLPWSSTF